MRLTSPPQCHTHSNRRLICVYFAGDRFMFRVYAGRTKHQIAETVSRRRRERAATQQCRHEMRQLLLPADVVRRVHGQMVCVAPKPVRERGVAAAEVHVPHVPRHILHSGCVLHRIGAHVTIAVSCGGYTMLKMK